MWWLHFSTRLCCPSKTLLTRLRSIRPCTIVGHSAIEILIAPLPLVPCQALCKTRTMPVRNTQLTNQALVNKTLVIYSI